MGRTRLTINIDDDLVYELNRVRFRENNKLSKSDAKLSFDEIVEYILYMGLSRAPSREF